MGLQREDNLLCQRAARLLSEPAKLDLEDIGQSNQEWGRMVVGWLAFRHENLNKRG
jgi:hypothetical protein